MRLGIAALLLLFAPIGAVAQPVSAADRAEVRRIADEIAASTERKQLYPLLDHLTDDALIDLAGRRYSKKSYEQYLRKAFPMISDYKYTRSNDAVRQDANGDIVLSFSLKEEYTVNHKKHTGNHKEEYYFRKVGGKLKIYKVIGG